MTGGRTSPMIHTGIDSSNFALTFSSVGVKNSVYYHSGYILSAFAQKEPGFFLWGKMRGGLGGGIHFAKRQYVDGTTSESASDFAIGPAIRVTWEIFPFGFIGIEALYGIRNAKVFVLSTQRITSLVFGIRF